MRAVTPARLAAMAAIALTAHRAAAQGIPPSRADTLRLTRGEARAQALRANPELGAARLAIGVARGEFRQAGLIRSNPAADLLGGGQGAEIGLTQEIEVAGQRGARRAAGRAGVERAVASVTDVARLTLGDVDRAFYQVVAANRRTALADEVLSLNERLVQVTGRQLAAGEISRFEFNLATVELGRSRSRRLATRRERDAAVSELRRLLALSPAQPLVPVLDDTTLVVTASRATAAGSAADSEGVAAGRGNGASPERLDVDSLTAAAMRQRPDLAERSAAVRQSSAEASVARREAFPNLALRGSSERVEGSSSRVLRPGIGLTLPVLNRNQGEVEARRAAARQAELERIALAARVRAEIARAVGTYETAEAEAEVLESTVLGPARENRRLLEIAYREGKVGLPVLLLIRNQVIDAELDYWTAWLAAREARADLAQATGETVASFDPRAPAAQTGVSP